MGADAKSMSATILERFRYVLETEDFTAAVKQAGEKDVMDTLQVRLFADSQGRDWLMQLYFLNDVGQGLGVPDGEDDTYYLQGVSVLPFRMPADKQGEAAQLLAELNRILPVGTLGMSQDEEALYYRASVAGSDRLVDEDAVADLVMQANFFLGLMGGPLEKLAKGQATRQEILKELEGKGLAPSRILPFPGVKF